MKQNYNILYKYVSYENSMGEKKSLDEEVVKKLLNWTKLTMSNTQDCYQASQPKDANETLHS